MLPDYIHKADSDANWVSRSPWSHGADCVVSAMSFCPFFLFFLQLLQSSRRSCFTSILKFTINWASQVDIRVSGCLDWVSTLGLTNYLGLIFLLLRAIIWQLCWENRCFCSWVSMEFCQFPWRICKSFLKLIFWVFRRMWTLKLGFLFWCTRSQNRCEDRETI